MKSKLSDVSSLSDLLIGLRNAILERMRDEGLKYDLTFSQTETMRFIAESGKETMGRIAGHLKITPPSTTEIVAELERKGLVERKRNANDGRVVYIVPSQTSKKICASLLKQRDKIFNKMISKLSEEDTKNLKRIIRILITE